MRRFFPVVAVSLAPIALAVGPLGGCGDDDSAPTADAEIPDAGASPEADAQAPYATFAFNIVEDESPATPIAGAIAFFDYADGTTELQTSDAKGHVQFFSASVAKGIVSVSVGSAGRTTTSIATPDPKTLAATPFALSQVASVPSHTLSGTLTLLNAGDGVGLGTSLPSTFVKQPSTTATSTYTLEVQAGQLFTVYGFELSNVVMSDRGLTQQIAKWFRFDHPSLTADTTFDIDVSKLASGSPKSVSGTIVIPGGDKGPLGGASQAFVGVGADSDQGAQFAPIGVATSLAVSADLGSFAYTLAYVPYPNVTVSTYAGIIAADGASTQRTRRNVLPTDGQVMSGFELPITLPSPLTDGSVIDATSTNPGDSVTLFVGSPAYFASSFENAAWAVTLPAGKASKLPRLPVALKKTLGTNLRAQIQTTQLPIFSSITGSRIVPFLP